MNPETQKALMDRLQKQNELAGTDVAADVYSPAAIGNGAPKQPIISNEFTTTMSSDERSKTSREKIEEVEQELAQLSGKNVGSRITPKAKSYLDELGNETFYVRNISNGHVSISDIDVTVRRNTCADLLKDNDLEKLRKSRDLKSMINDNFLERMSPEEYLIERKQELQNKKMIEGMRADAAITSQQAAMQKQSGTAQQQQFNQPTSPRIRPTILSKLEKLRLSGVPEHAHLGMNYVEFVQWAVTESLGNEELDFIASHPTVINHPENMKIREALYKRKSQI